MKRLIATLGVAAALALTAAGSAGATPFFAKEDELRNGADDPAENQIQLIGKESEPRDGHDDPIVGREGEPRNGADDGADDRTTPQIVGKEDELRDGKDDVIVGRENELRDGQDDGADDHGGDRA